MNQYYCHFVSNRPLNDTSTKKKDFDIWYVDREHKNKKWSEPKNMGKPINSDLDEFYPTLSDNNNLYFTMSAPDGLGKDDIYFCKWDAGSYLAPVLLSDNINSIGYEFNAFISKKEDFILYKKYEKLFRKIKKVAKEVVIYIFHEKKQTKLGENL